MRRSSTGIAAVLATAATLALVPAAATAASGKTTLRLNGPAAQALRAQGVKIAPTGAARGGERRLVLPTRAGLAGQRTTLLRQRGAVVFRLGKRKARFSQLTVVLAKRSRVEARLGGARVELFALGRNGRRQVDSVRGTARLSGLNLTLTRAAARKLAARLGLGKVARGRFGVLAARAAGLTTSGGEIPGKKGPGGAAQGGGGGGATQSTSCPLPGSAGSTPEDPLPVLPRPPAAVDITSASVRWYVRESFIRYINTGEGTSVSGGAVADPPVLVPGTSTALSYSFQFPFAAGWVDRGADPGNPADDTAWVKFGGALSFRWAAHGIDITAADPELELRGTSSRAIFAVSEGGGPAARQVLLNLDLGRAAAIRVDGNTFTYEKVPGAIPSTATSTFAGFYTPGTDFGCFTVSFQAGG